MKTSTTTNKYSDYQTVERIMRDVWERGSSVDALRNVREILENHDKRLVRSLTTWQLVKLLFNK